METKSNYWLDQAAEAVSRHYPDGEIVVSSGISPSASYHIGHFREILTADALAWALRRHGRKARHIHVVDNFDPLRKRYSFLPERFEAEVGKPICLVPDPEGDCHATYADHFFEEFRGYAEQMGIVPDQIVKSYEDLYRSGRMAPHIESVLENSDIIRRIFEATSNRQLAADWTPVQVLNQEDRFENAALSSWDSIAKEIAGAKIDSGRVKLNWRLDWPARWKELGVMVEPFSAQEHGAAGGSYDTGTQFAREVFDIEPPIPGVQYANIHLLGDTKKMSSSKGNLVTPAQALEIMPPEILRYFVVRSKPDRTLYWDGGLGLYNLIDEFAKVEQAARSKAESQFKEAYEFAVAGSGDKATISSVPFSHLVAVYQAASGDFAQITEILERTGYETVADKEKDVLKREVSFVANWLKKYAPDSVKFSVQEKLPAAELSEDQKAFLAQLSEKISEEKRLTGQGMHDLIYSTVESSGLKPAQAFSAIYRVILGKDSGPKAGWFLASLDHDWLVKRLKLAA